MTRPEASAVGQRPQAVFPQMSSPSLRSTCVSWGSTPPNGFDVSSQEERLFILNVLGLASSPTESIPCEGQNWAVPDNRTARV